VSTQFDWKTGTPDIPKGKMRNFWCAVKSPSGEILSGLVYFNAFRMPLSDSQDEAPACAVLVNEDDDEYEWTGWCEDSCEACETYWMFHGEVIAWIELPTKRASGVNVTEGKAE
jgi:hypothetical protein